MKPDVIPFRQAAIWRKSEQCRRNARYCTLLAADAANETDRNTLLTMQRSWLALADNEEWLEGMRSARQSMSA